ncbi:metallophosphoesterase family protein [Dyadobacter psychrotolerans]|uniref:Metallophosphoesterase n=1 Tax=Dyadobacter psychrotolerans TaxID=2541721 RepID=A0A4V2Z338_9BACT|nr:metallophosphoesterase [Dyadobacter psychrotolerans]TDE11288.1 metallophosphoesterase [Dyadobacter psychrotolerans]
MSLLPAHKHATPVFKKDQPDDNFKFQPLPKPTGSYPYHLSLEKIRSSVSDKKLVFQMVGDTGSIRSPDFQQLVAGQMKKQYDEEIAQPDKPAFLFHLGDVVYNFGEAEKYSRQFFEPYDDYPGLIFAIPGNHDSDVNPDNPVPYKSLDAFTRVFCSTESLPVPFSGKTDRKSMIQPNVYWTLETPLANIIGLHGNVTKYGSIKEEQQKWFFEELKNAQKQRPEKAIIVCIHHAPYSADINHGSSQPMIELFDRAYKETGIHPDIVFSGHVHTYQRFSKKYDDGKFVPFVVAGAGGYDELHAVAALSDDRFTAESPLFDNVKLENYCDNKHGFLKITLEKTSSGVELRGEYYTIPHENITETYFPAALADKFNVTIN